ncbi:hypothetical protein H4R34_001106 [Dimargaris verticillata]|uniref:Uncharacterized protein n=1 Tax=Dimargaris verticillata TaxID=2761393 RepID=A0A9W8EFA7_9FUNG|nr:hypothetical protein H4R34_001106 [Dimargaris verticillata]
MDPRDFAPCVDLATVLRTLRQITAHCQSLHDNIRTNPAAFALQASDARPPTAVRTYRRNRHTNRCRSAQPQLVGTNALSMAPPSVVLSPHTCPLLTQRSWDEWAEHSSSDDSASDADAVTDSAGDQRVGPSADPHPQPMRSQFDRRGWPPSPPQTTSSTAIPSPVRRRCITLRTCLYDLLGRLWDDHHTNWRPPAWSEIVPGRRYKRRAKGGPTDATSLLIKASTLLPTTVCPAPPTISNSPATPTNAASLRVPPLGLLAAFALGHQFGQDTDGSAVTATVDAWYTAVPPHWRRYVLLQHATAFIVARHRHVPPSVQANLYHLVPVFASRQAIYQAYSVLQGLLHLAPPETLDQWLWFYSHACRLGMSDQWINAVRQQLKTFSRPGVAAFLKWLDASASALTHHTCTPIPNDLGCAAPSCPINQHLPRSTNGGPPFTSRAELRWQLSYNYRVHAWRLGAWHISLDPAQPRRRQRPVVSTMSQQQLAALNEQSTQFCQSMAAATLAAVAPNTGHFDQWQGRTAISPHAILDDCRLEDTGRPTAEPWAATKSRLCDRVNVLANTMCAMACMVLPYSFATAEGDGVACISQHWLQPLQTLVQAAIETLNPAERREIGAELVEQGRRHISSRWALVQVVAYQHLGLVCAAHLLLNQLVVDWGSQAVVPAINSATTTFPSFRSLVGPWSTPCAMRAMHWALVAWQAAGCENPDRPPPALPQLLEWCNQLAGQCPQANRPARQWQYAADVAEWVLTSPLRPPPTAPPSRTLTALRTPRRRNAKLLVARTSILSPDQLALGISPRPTLGPLDNPRTSPLKGAVPLVLGAKRRWTTANATSRAALPPEPRSFLVGVDRSGIEGGSHDLPSREAIAPAEPSSPLQYKRTRGGQERELNTLLSLY